MFSIRSGAVLSSVLLLVGIPTSTVIANGDDDPWTQVGQVLPGESSEENFGRAVALNELGTIMAIGASGADTNQGRVEVFELAGGQWSPLGPPILGSGAEGYFGHSLALSANGLVLAVGAPKKVSPLAGSGEVRVFDLTDGNWVARITLPGEFTNESSGQSVALSSDGSRVVIGSPGFFKIVSMVGRVRVFDWSGDTWTQKGLDVEGPSGGKLGESVDMSADGVSFVAGAPNSFLKPGAALVYSWNGSAWVQKGLEIPGLANGDSAGTAVSMDASGNTVAVGSPESGNEGLSAVGSVRVFDYLAGDWQRRGDIVNGQGAGDKFGLSVSLNSNGTGFIAGAPRNSDAGALAGNARVFQYSTDNWVQRGADLGGVAEGNTAGFAVAMSGLGTRVALGEPLHDQPTSSPPLTNSGQVRVFGYQEPSTIQPSESVGVGLPGIYLHIAGFAGRSVIDSPVYYGAYRVKAGSAFVLSVREVGANRVLSSNPRTLATGVVNQQGHFTGRMLLPALSPGDYTISFTGTHATGTGLSLVAPLRVGASGEFVTLGSNLPGIW